MPQQASRAQVSLGLVLAVATPELVQERLRAAFVAAIAQPAMRNFLQSQGMQIAPELTPSALRGPMTAETERWARVIREANVKGD